MKATVAVVIAILQNWKFKSTQIEELKRELLYVFPNQERKNFVGKEKQKILSVRFETDRKEKIREE